ncbi:hypothetical protein BDZ94DRAFT_264913 [Collybia nuda]|uniref:Transmembrane protein n=1 Tax=Collybia nuda TaxID=64659 RepID=A0A9P6CDK2_9AGAR|nr:hypothetical protein BDZ94DRAFT_264913 [Collybia nuda]
MTTFQNVDDRDPRVVYSGSWVLGGVDQEFNRTTHGTVAGGSQARFTFNGSSVTVYGTITNEPVGGIVLPPSSTYSIDGSTNATFNPVPTSIQYRQIFYQSPVLQNTQHVLVITSLVSNSVLWLDFFQVGTVDTPPPSTSVLPSTISVTNHPQPSSTRSLPPAAPTASTKEDDTSVPAGVIIGGVIGSLVLVALMAIVIWVALRRRAPQNLLPKTKYIKNWASQDYSKYPPFTPKENLSMFSTASLPELIGDPQIPSPPASGNPIGFGYQRGGGLITMTAALSKNSPYRPGPAPAPGNRGRETTNERFTQVMYYQNEKRMPLRVIGVVDIPPAYASPS